MAGRQIDLIDVNFHLESFWKFLIKTQMTKSDPKRTIKWWNGGTIVLVSSHCIMLKIVGFKVTNTAQNTAYKTTNY